jgi:hypothetical protein
MGTQNEFDKFDAPRRLRRFAYSLIILLRNSRRRNFQKRCFRSNRPLDAGAEQRAARPRFPMLHNVELTSLLRRQRFYDNVKMHSLWS